VNGAQLFFTKQFGIKGDDARSTWLMGLVNAAPYMCCAFVGCWLTVPFNHFFGRRGAIFVSCCISTLAVIWQTLTNSWWHMFIARFALGLAIGPKSATVPIYAAETAPPAIRGALVMQWQVWTAFGIMLGYAADLAFYAVPDTPHIVGLNWRLMLGSAMIPAIIVCCFIYTCPESPRWYLGRGRHDKAYASMQRLRFSKVQAARDIFYMHAQLETEASIRRGRNKITELITVPRNRRAMLASEILMFMQQVRSRLLTRTLSSSPFCFLPGERPAFSSFQPVHPPLTRGKTVLRRQHHRLLLVGHLPAGALLGHGGAGGVARLRRHQLPLRAAGRAHH
jgi:MFS family permease